MKRMATIIREYGPFPGIKDLHGVSFDGRRVWFASGAELHALDPDSGALLRTLEMQADAGTAFDGTHLFQIAGPVIHRIDPESGTILATIPSPGADSSGLAWAEGMLWVGQYRGCRIHQVDPATGAVLRSIDSDRFVTGVTLGRWRVVARRSARRRQRSAPHRPRDRRLARATRDAKGTGVSGLEADGGERFFCGGGASGRLQVVSRKADGGGAQDPKGT